MSETILNKVLQPHAKLAVKACHASSKTFTSADAVLLSLLLGGDVITTAPTWLQVEQVLWGAIRRGIEDSVFPAKEWGDVNRTEIRLPTGEFAIGLSTDQSVRFQGHHARPESFLLLILDEAPGVIPGIYEAIEGIASAGDVRRLYLGNPVISSGPFFDIFAGDAPGWERFTIDAFDTPNLSGLSLESLLELSDDELDRSERPYLVTRRWVRDRYYEWGETHPLWESRVRGAFPLQAEDALISLAWLEQARQRGVQDTVAAPLVAGIDVAGPGEDETVLTLRRGDAVLDLQAFAQADARGAVLAALAVHAARLRSKADLVVNVDSAGIGHYFGLALQDAGYTVRLVNVGESPTTDQQHEKFANLKAEVCWAFRERAQRGALAGLRDQRAISQLAGIRYQHDSRGRIVIESKADARKRGVKSPDRAESVILAFWDDPRGAWARAVGSSATIGYHDPAPPHPAGPAREEMDRDAERQAARRTARRLERRSYS